MFGIKIAVTPTKRPMKKPLQKIIGFFLFTTKDGELCSGSCTGLRWDMGVRHISCLGVNNDSRARKSLAVTGDGGGADGSIAPTLIASLDFDAGTSIFILKGQLRYPVSKLKLKI